MSASTISAKETLGMILVIDDEPVLADLADQFLRRAGFDVAAFTLASEALEWLKSQGESVDMIIMDMKMPGITATECFDALRKANPSAHIALMSGYVDDEEASSLLARGALRFFQKPIRYPQLVSWIESILSESELKRVENP